MAAWYPQFRRSGEGGVELWELTGVIGWLARWERFLVPRNDMQVGEFGVIG
jgi:hypothetical protein